MYDDDQMQYHYGSLSDCEWRNLPGGFEDLLLRVLIIVSG
jgi:hypothetical protein